MLSNQILTIHTDDSTLEGAHEVTLKVNYLLENHISIDAALVFDFRSCLVSLTNENWILDDLHVPAYSSHKKARLLYDPPSFSYHNVDLCNYRWKEAYDLAASVDE